jgi:M6 family metalloprotease-like protein
VGQLKKISEIAIIILACLGFTLASCDLIYADVLPIQGVTRQSADSLVGNHPHARPLGDVSQRNLLGLQRSDKSLLPVTALSAAEDITIRMCAVRVQFEYEDPDDEATTRRGNFDFRTKQQFDEEERHTIDPAPHNREFFEKHIEALHNYWNTVSDGRVSIEGTVFPSLTDSVYTLGHTMGYYGNRGDTGVVNGLAEFFYDAITLADQDDEIDWAAYDVFVVFHAGSDRQNDLGFPLTPGDLFTGFIMMAYGVPVDDNTVIIMEGMIMPETASQDNRATALNAVMAHEFGHQLGLVDLYDTRTNTTMIGDFSLMDNNGFGTGVDLNMKLTRTILGTLPLYPDAWSRAYLGFVEVEEIEAGDFDVRAAELALGTDKVYKIPISENEYFLIENRQVVLDDDTVRSLKADLDGTGVILGPAPNPETVPPGQPAPLTREYDYLMPGDGMVIWHVDETVAWMDYDGDGVNNFRDNDLQWYNYYPNYPDENRQWDNHPFVRLIEADGIIDFGGYYWTNYGRAADYFEASGNNHFGPNTNPATKSNSNAYTGIDVYNITGSDTLMSFRLKQEVKTEGWPHHTDSSIFAPALYDIDDDGVAEVFVSGKNHILGFKAGGDFIFQPVPGNEIISERIAVPPGPLNQPIHIDTLRAIAAVGGQRITTPPTIADLNNDGIAEVAFGTATGYLYLFEIKDDDADGFADLLDFTKISNVSIEAPIVVAEADNSSAGSELIAGDVNGNIYILGSDGTLLEEKAVSGAIIQFSISPDFEYAYILYGTEAAGGGTYVIEDLNNSSNSFTFNEQVLGFSAGYVDSAALVWLTAITGDGKVYAFDNSMDYISNQSAQEQFDIGQSISSKPVLFPSLPEFGRSQVSFAGDNKLYVYNLNGTSADYFPRVIDIHDPAGAIISPPIIIDVTGEGEAEFVLGTPDGEIYLIAADGSVLINSPLAAPMGISTSLAFWPETEERKNRGNLYAVTDDGLIYSYTLPSPGTIQNYFYSQADGGAHHRNFQDNLLSVSTEESGILNYCYNWPNPAREATNIRFELNEDAEANIRIYDLAGRLIYEDNMQAIGGMANEYTWPLDNYPSGVYPCRLEVKGSSGSDVRLWNIAVVK